MNHASDTLPIAPLADTHCHIDYITRQDPEKHPLGADGIDAKQVVARALAQGVELMVNPSVSPNNMDEVLRLAEQFEPLYAALAVHPTDVKDIKEMPDWLEQIETKLSHPKVVAIGETGLDYYWDTSEKALQQECFRKLLALAQKHDLPVIVHDRDAHEDIETIISEFPGVRGIMHCFSGDSAFALRMIEKGFYISFAGNVTFKKAIELQQAATVIALDRLLIETDSPFLSPMPHRGKPNEPARVSFVAEKIAQLRNITYDEVAQVTTENAKKVYGLC